MFDADQDLPRAVALAEVLCAAAQIDDELDPDEATAIEEELMRLLDRTDLPDELARLVRAFDPRRFDLVDALTRLRLADLSHKKALLRSVRTIIKADAITRETERDFFARLAHTLRLNPQDID